MSRATVRKRKGWRPSGSTFATSTCRLSDLGHQQADAAGAGSPRCPTIRSPKSFSLRPTCAPARPRARSARRVAWPAAAPGPHRRAAARARIRRVRRPDRARHPPNYPEEAAHRARLGKFYHRPPGGESWADVILRLRSAMNSINLHYNGRRVLIVCHQVVVLCMRYVLEELEEADILAIDKAAEILNCGICAFDFERAGARLRAQARAVEPRRAARGARRPGHRRARPDDRQPMSVPAELDPRHIQRAPAAADHRRRQKCARLDPDHRRQPRSGGRGAADRARRDARGGRAIADRHGGQRRGRPVHHHARGDGHRSSRRPRRRVRALDRQDIGRAGRRCRRGGRRARHARNGSTEGLAAALVQRDKPLVLDAALLHALPARRNEVNASGCPTILLPHAGEMASLLGCEEEEVEADPARRRPPLRRPATTPLRW